MFIVNLTYIKPLDTVEKFSLIVKSSATKMFL